MKALTSGTKRPRPYSNHANSAHSSTSTGKVSMPKSRAPTAAVSPPTSIELRGVPIHFPFQPYKCQEDYMAKVLDALIRSENALLESPTGTGKTLCLLCAALAWQREMANELKSSAFSGAAISNVATNPSEDPNTDSLRLSQSLTDTQKPQKNRAPTIIYASRTHSQLAQVIRELRNTRYRPKHTVLGSREQMCVNPKVKKKTATASEINHDCSKLGMERKCQYKNRLDGFTPPNVEAGVAISPNTQPVLDIEDLVDMGKTHKVCPFYHTRSLVESAELVLVPYNYLFDKDARTSTLSDIPWSNAIVIFDEAHNLESFASDSASFDLTSTDIAGCVADITRAMMYMQNNDALQGRITEANIVRLKALLLQLEEYILGLPNQPSAYVGEYMMEIFKKGMHVTFNNHHFLLQEIKKVMDIFMEVQGGSNSRGSPRLEHFCQCIKRVFGCQSEGRCLAKAKSYRVHVTPKNNTNNNKNATGRTVSYWCFAPAEAMGELASLNVRSILVTSGTLSPLESYALELGIPFPHRLENPHIIPDDQIHVRVLGKGVSGKLLSSSYERRQDNEYYLELGNTLVSLAKVVPGGMLVFFPSYGVMEACIEKWGGPASSSQFQKKKGGNFFAPRRQKPGGKDTARFSFSHSPLSSYGYGGGGGQVVTPWKRLLATKAAVVEPRSTTDLTDAIAEFHKHLGLPKSKGCLLFGVCRGKISEGIDFAHDMCRAVVITGLPFAPSFDPKVKMKREFLDSNRATQNMKPTGDGGGFADDSNKPSNILTGHEWYTQQAHRAVNQAVGRVIRNKNDYGAVLLLDSRFGQPRNQEGLSKWVRPHILNDEGFGKCVGTLVRFYREAEKKSEERNEREAAMPPPKPNPIPIILQYEDDQEDAPTKKVMYIRNSTATTATGGGGTTANEHNNGYIPPSDIISPSDNTSNETSEAPNMIDKQKSVDTTSANSAQKPASLQDLYNSTHTATNPSPKSAETNANNKTDPKMTPAFKLFTQMQGNLPPTEFSSAKKLLVSLKKAGDKNDRKVYIRVARELIRALLPHDSTFGRTTTEPSSNEVGLLDLLFQLLPKAMRRDVKRATMIEVFDRSKLSNIAKEHLTAANCKVLRSETASLLFQMWYDDKKISTTALLGKSRDILLKFEKDLAVQIIFLTKLGKTSPEIYHQTIFRMIQELKAAENIRQMKEKERAKDLAIINDSKMDHNMAPSTSLMKKSNPYAKQTNNDSSSKVQKQKQSPQPSKDSKSTTSPAVVANGGAKKGPLSLAKFLAKSGSAGGNGLQASKMKSGAIQTVIHQSKSATFLGKPTAVVHIPSNAPKQLTCQICNNRLDKPFISPCRHMACWPCWDKWLAKSQVCPNCREPTRKGDLAQAVYQNL